jgi:hypothetical protein
MQVDYKEGQEMMKLGYLQPEEVKKMAGEPAQVGGNLDKKPKEENAVGSYQTGWSI